MESREGPFIFMMEIDRLAVDLHRFGDRSVIELNNCMFSLANLTEVHMLENKPTGLERAETERVVGNQHNRFRRQQQDSKTISASKDTATVDRGEKNRRPRNRLEGN